MKQTKYFPRNFIWVYRRFFFLRYFPIIIRTDHAFDFSEMEGSGRWLVMYWSVKTKKCP